MNREALFSISYGLYIITSIKGDNINGFVGNTAFQITSKPARIAIGVSVDNYTYGFIRESGIFAVSVLNQSIPGDIIRTFGYTSGRDVNKFQEITYQTGTNGAPIITERGINAFFECKVEKEVQLETHAIFIGSATDGEVLAEEPPLTYDYYRNTMRGKAPKNAPTFSEETETASKDSSGKYICSVCGYEYDPSKGDPEHGIPPGTEFKDLPQEWKCPICSASKSQFKQMQ